MDQGFWLQTWEEGRLRFHRDTVHSDLVAWSERFLGDGRYTVLVPLCGKSVDLLWLRDEGHEVTGVELAERAVHQLHAVLPEPEVSREGAFQVWRTPGLTLMCGDFFEMDRSLRFERIWDRAALVALPREMRDAYAELELALLAPGGRILLVAYHYDEAVMDGPPFSVSEEEVRELYAGAHIEVVDDREVADQIPMPGHDWFRVTSYLISR